MENGEGSSSLSRRQLLRMIGAAAGGSAMYQAMSSLGFAADSPYQGPIDLQGAPRGASVVVLGAGMAGMTAAYELRNAGYQVQVLEYNARAGGRNWTLRGGDRYTELGGHTQQCEFDKDLYINPGPWRIPYHHHGMMHYTKLLRIPLEPFFQVNYNAYLHSSSAFGGKPQRFREVKADYQGHIAELLAKATQQNALDATVTKEDREMLLESLRQWGALDSNHTYVASEASGDRRGYEKSPGGGLSGRPIHSKPIALHDILDSGLWSGVANGDTFDMQTALFQPAGGMGRIGEAFGRELGPLIRHFHRHAKSGRAANCSSRLVPVHHSPPHPGANLHERWPKHGIGDFRSSLCAGAKGRIAIQAPLLGGGRKDLWRHHLYRLADHEYRLPQHRFSERRQRRAAGRLHLGLASDGIYDDDTAGAGAKGRRLRQPNPPAIPQGIREWRCRGVASRTLHDGVFWHVDVRDARQAL
jgi:hypothetical protein